MRQQIGGKPCSKTIGKQIHWAKPVQNAYFRFAYTKIAGGRRPYKPCLASFYYPKTAYFLLKPFAVKGFERLPP